MHIIAETVHQDSVHIFLVQDYSRHSFQAFRGLFIVPAGCRIFVVAIALVQRRVGGHKFLRYIYTFAQIFLIRLVQTVVFGKGGLPQKETAQGCATGIGIY